MGSNRKKKHFFHVVRVPFNYHVHSHRKWFYRKPMVPMESHGSGGMPFASLESL